MLYTVDETRSSVLLDLRLENSRVEIRQSHASFGAVLPNLVSWEYHKSKRAISKLSSLYLKVNLHSRVLSHSSGQNVDGYTAREIVSSLLNKLLEITNKIPRFHQTLLFWSFRFACHKFRGSGLSKTARKKSRVFLRNLNICASYKTRLYSL